MREQEVTSQVKARLEQVLQEVPFVRLKGQRRADAVSESQGADLAVEVQARGGRWLLLVEVISVGEPRYVRSAVQKLRNYVYDRRMVYRMVAAPYISPETGKICTNEGMGYLDLAGNCALIFGDLFIERRGNPKARVERRPLRTLFAPKASRILRILLEEPRRAWTLTGLAEKTGVSLGQIFKVKERLLDLELMSSTDEGVILSKPEEAIRKWAANYSYAKNETFDSYGQGDVAELESKLAEYCTEQGIRYGFTLFSGAARVAPYARYLKGAAYVDGVGSEVALNLGWKPVLSGANFTLLKEYDEGVYSGLRKIDGDFVVSDVQLYLDLVGSRTRGEEAANFLLEQRLKTKW